MVFPWEPNKAQNPGCGNYINGFHMPLKACAYRKKGMMQFAPWTRQRAERLFSHPRLVGLMINVEPALYRDLPTRGVLLCL